MISKQPKSSDYNYDGVNADEDTDSTDIDIDTDSNTDSNVGIDSFEMDMDSEGSSAAEVPFGVAPLGKRNSSIRGCENRRGIRCFPPLFVLGIGAFFSLAWSLSHHLSWKTSDSTADSASNSDSIASKLDSTSAKFTPTKASMPIAESKTIPPRTHDSPFFEHMLEWKKVPPGESPSNKHTLNRTTIGGENVGAGTGDHHYWGSIEFCSDPSNELYGYGPVGNCVPGRAAPLIRMQPKRYYHLTLYNNAHIDTNLHTHGLHVSGVGTVDDVTRVAKPGECLVYDHYILDDADVGTFWYHPHRHPHVQKSAYGGAYGMLIVDETDEIAEQYYPEQLRNFLTRNEVLLQFSSMYNEKLENPVRINKVNGQDHLRISLPTQYYYFRISAVTYDDVENYVEFDPPDACSVRVVAYDGVYRSEIPARNFLHKHMMTVGSRADFAVLCYQNASIHFHQGNFTDQSNMVTILVDDRGDSPVSPFEVNNDPTLVSLSATLPSQPYWGLGSASWKPRRPYYMPDLAAPNNVVDEYWSVSLDDYFVNGTHGHLLNQRKWDPNHSLRTFELGQLVEYPILRSREHPYHAHVNRMQIVEPGGCGGRFEEGQYFDTIFQTEDTPGGCLIRTKFFDFSGRVVIHCHRFEHEDHGMMAWIDVVGGDDHGIEGAPATSCAAVL